MALAEARAALHRTANRCLVQEDAKRAPRLAYCSSVPTNSRHTNAVSNASGGQHVPSAVSIPFNLNPSFPNLSPNSKWWLHPQSNHSSKKCSVDEQFSSLEASMEVCPNPCLIDQTTSKILFCDGEKLEIGVKEDGFGPFSSWNCQDPIKLEDKEDDVRELKVEYPYPEVVKNANETCFDLKSSWIGSGRNSPWWRIADGDELASLVAQRSLDYIENCDLPLPQNTHVKGRDGISQSLPDPKHGAGSHHRYSSCLRKAGNLTSGNACQKLSVLAEAQSASIIDKPLRDFATHETLNDASKAQLMEALCHSQTRAREAEKAAKQACEEKENVVKLVFRQASQLFAYKQWLQILQLESIYLEFLNNSNHSVPLTPQRIKRTHMSSRSARQCNSEYESNKYAVAFAIGLGLAGAGFLLGWTIASMFPSW